ncbi:MAG: L-lactate dehydrogenase [Peptococcaceae bacterium]|nr:L-lactate dehydrogenase [Peptococcaceae bacterium]
MGIQPTKVSIIGAGFVGATTAYTLMLSGLVSEIVLVDVNKDKAIGEEMDLSHGMPFIQPVKVTAGDYSDCEDSDIVVITAGANQKPGETRIDLVKKNTEVFRTIIPQIVKHCGDSILLVVTNPVDILTYVTYKISGFKKEKVMGSGTVLDTARFRSLLGEHFGVDARNVHSYILGEHGDTEVATWSITNIAGMSMESFCKNCDENIKRELFEDVRKAAYRVIEKKGATYYAVALTVRRIVEAILRDENSILTVSSLVEGIYGLTDVCLSLPTIVNSTGISSVLPLDLSESEKKALINSGNSLQEVIRQIF